MSFPSGACRVLVVEDDALSRNALTTLLRQIGCTVTSAGSIEQAEPLIDGQTHVITDLSLHERTGVELLRLVRQRREQPRVAVVTALERDADLVRNALALEPDLLMRKPVDVNVLLDWITGPPQ